MILMMLPFVRVFFITFFSVCFCTNFLQFHCRFLLSLAAIQFLKLTLLIGLCDFRLFIESNTPHLYKYMWENGDSFSIHGRFVLYMIVVEIDIQHCCQTPILSHFQQCFPRFSSFSLQLLLSNFISFFLFFTFLYFL